MSCSKALTSGVFSIFFVMPAAVVKVIEPLSQRLIVVEPMRPAPVAGTPADVKPASFAVRVMLEMGVSLCVV